LWAVVSAGYPALLSSCYFERINDDDDDIHDTTVVQLVVHSVYVALVLKANTTCTHDVYDMSRFFALR